MEKFSTAIYSALCNSLSLVMLCTNGFKWIRIDSNGFWQSGERWNPSRTRCRRAESFYWKCSAGDREIECLLRVPAWSFPVDSQANLWQHSSAICAWKFHSDGIKIRKYSSTISAPHRDAAVAATNGYNFIKIADDNRWTLAKSVTWSLWESV